MNIKNPALDKPELLAAVEQKTQQVRALLQTIVDDFSPAVFANSLGAEDMVLTDLIIREKFPIAIFSLDTGRLPPETYALMTTIYQYYGVLLTLYYPRHELVETYTRQHGVNAFYESVKLRKTCCHARKVEPLQRALADKKAWVTGLRAQQSATRGGLPTQSFDDANGLTKFNPLADWSEAEVWAYLKKQRVPYNALHDRFFPSIGCAPCTRAITPGEDIRSGRWWWEDADSKECGLHRKI